MLVDLDTKHRFYLETLNSAIFIESWVGGFTHDNKDNPTFLLLTSQEWDPPSLHLTEILRNLPLPIDMYIIYSKSMHLIGTQDAYGNG
jgi:hypothetical protein